MKARQFERWLIEMDLRWHRAQAEKLWWLTIPIRNRRYSLTARLEDKHLSLWFRFSDSIFPGKLKSLRPYLYRNGQPLPFRFSLDGQTRLYLSACLPLPHFDQNFARFLIHEMAAHIDGLYEEIIRILEG